jgi:hypothetical protein
MSRAIVIGAAGAFLLLVCAVKAQGPPTLPEHKVLAMQEGTWDAEITVTVPGQEASKSKGVETNRLIGAKWLISDVKSEFGGHPFEGHGVNGYDTDKSKYVSTWIDSMSTRIEFMEGTYDEKTKTLTMHADSKDPATGKPIKMRLEMKFKGDDTRVLDEYVQTEGQKEFAKFMEIKYTKQKK